MENRFDKLLEVIDADFIRENPDTIYDLIAGLIKDIRNYKDCLETYKQINMLDKAWIQELTVKLRKNEK